MLAQIRSLLLRRLGSKIVGFDYWDKSKHELWQVTRLKALITQVERHVPYYRRVFREIGFTAADFKTIEDLAKLPFTTRDDLFANGPEAFCDERIPPMLRSPKNTGGSSGTPCPLLAFRPLSSLWEQAYMVEQWRRFGFRLRDRVAVLRGPIVFDKSRIYEFRKKENRLILSTYDLSDERLEDYIEALNRFQIRFLHVYPASLALLIDYIRRRPKITKFPYLKGVLAGSEGLLPNQKEFCQTVLGVPCFHWYGHTEMALMGGWCEKAETFHFFPEYGHLELVSESGARTADATGLGELVGTGFRNPATILIRYRTGDLGSGLLWDKCTCGRDFPTLARIYGRKQDYLIANDGCKIPATALIFGLHLPIFDCYRRVQVEQFQPGFITVRLENPQRVTDHRAIDLSKHAMEKALRGRMSVSFEEVDAIPLMPNRKHRLLVQHLPGLS